MSGVEIPGTFGEGNDPGNGLQVLEYLEDDDVIRHFNSRIRLAADFCEKVWNNARENNRFASPTPGAQWDEGDYKRRNQSGRFAYTINDIALATNALSGQEITQRYQRTFKGRSDDQDHLVAEAINTADRKIRELALAEHVESDAFRTLGLEGYAWLEWYQDHMVDYRGQISVRAHEIWNVLWDPTARKPMLLDRDWDAVGQWVSLDHFLALFPSSREDLMSLFGRPEGWVKGDGEGTTARWPWLYRSRHGQYLNRDRSEVFLVDYQWRQRSPLWVVEVPNPADPTGEMLPPTWEKFTDEAEAKQRIDELTHALGGRKPHVVGPDDGLHTWDYRRASIVGEKVLRTGKIDEGMFTRTCMTGFPYRQMEEVTYHGIVDYMKDPQRFKNTVISLMTTMMQRSMKGGLIYDPKGFNNPQQLADLMAQPYPMIPTKEGVILNGNGQMPWREIPVNTFPSGLDNFLQMADMAVWRPVGLNPDVLGQIKDMRRVSGVVFSSVSEAGSVVLGYLFNSLKLYRQLSGRQALAILRTSAGYDETRLREMVGEKLADSIPPREEWETFFDRDVVVDEEAAATKDKRMELWDLLSRHGADKYVQGGLMPPKIVAALMPGISETERLEWQAWLEEREALEQLQQQLQTLQTQLQIQQTQMQMMQLQQQQQQMQAGQPAPEEGAPPEGAEPQPQQEG